MESYKGFFKPKNKNKYIGNVKKIVYRSSLELRFMNYLDQHPDIISWSSEEFSIPYVSPVDDKIHRYFPDFLVKKRNKDGIEEKLVIEIKPRVHINPPDATKIKSKKRLIEETIRYSVNQAKWEAAERFCKDHSMKFVILHEENLGVVWTSKKKSPSFKN